MSSAFQAEKLALQRVLRKSYPLPAYDANPLVIPFMGSALKILKLSGHTARPLVNVVFDEMDPISMEPGQTITGLRFRQVRISKAEDGPTDVELFLSKENEGMIPDLVFDREPSVGLRGGVDVARTTGVLIPSGWRSGAGSWAGPAPLITLFDPDSETAETIENFEAVEFFFEFFYTIEDDASRATIATAGGSGYIESLDIRTSFDTILTDLLALTGQLTLSGASYYTNSPRLGLMVFQGSTPTATTNFDTVGTLVPFRNDFNVPTNKDLFCCDGGRFRLDKPVLTHAFLPSMLDDLLASRHGTYYALNGDTVPRFGVRWFRNVITRK